MEEKHISSDHRHNHHHDHHKQQEAPSGTENHHAKESHGAWVCHRCGWTYPNPHPNAKHRRNHRKHCGKIEGFPLIAPGDRETQGGSSDEESTDDEHKATDHQKRTPAEQNNISLQRQASAPTSDFHIRNLDIKSSEADPGKAGPKQGAPDAILNILEAKESDLGKIDQNPKEATKSVLGDEGHGLNLSGTTKPSDDFKGHDWFSFEQGDEVHGLNLSGTVKPSDNFKGHDWFSFEQKSNIFLKEEPDIDSSHTVIGDIGPKEFPVKGSHTMSDYPELESENNQTDRFLDSSPPIVQIHPESSNNVDGLGFQIMNDRVKQHSGFDDEWQSILDEVKKSVVKTQDTGYTEQPRTFGMPTTIPMHVTQEHDLGISSKKVGIASILEQNSLKGENSDESKIKVPLAEKTLESADQKTYELFQIGHQVSGNTKQGVSIFEQDMIHDVAHPSVCGEGSHSEKSLGHILNQKEDPQSLAYGPETGKMLKHASSAALIESNFVDNFHPEVTKCMISSQEKSSVEDVRLEDSDIPPPISEVSKIHKDGELEKERKDPSSEGLDKTSYRKLDSQTSSELFISDQKQSFADSLTTGSTKAGELQQVENNGITNPGISEHEIRFMDTEIRKNESAQRNIIMTDEDIDRNTKAPVMSLEKFPKTSPQNTVKHKPLASEFLLPDARDSDLNFQGIGNAESRALLQESKHNGNGQILEQSVVDKRHQFKEVVSDTSLEVHPAATATVDNSWHWDVSKHDPENPENPFKYATDDTWGNINESTENHQPALWEKLLERDVKGAINQETYQELGNAGTSPVNPFIHEYRIPNKVEPQIFSIQGGQAQTSGQLNNDSTEVERKHPSTNKGVEEDPLASQVGWFASFPEVTNESHARKVDNVLRTDASEMIPGALELPPTQLRNSPPRSSNAKPEEKKKVNAKSIWNLCTCCCGAS